MYEGRDYLLLKIRSCTVRRLQAGEPVNNFRPGGNEVRCIASESEYTPLAYSELTAEELGALGKALSEIEIYGNRTDEDITKPRYMD